jgi:hypothetical protein
MVCANWLSYPRMRRGPEKLRAICGLTETLVQTIVESERFHRFPLKSEVTDEAFSV